METNSALLERYVERYNAGDLDACMELYADDAVQRMHDGSFEGLDSIRARLGRDLHAFPDARYVVESFVEDGDRFADEWTFTGTNDGPFRLPDGTEVPATGRSVEIKGMELVEVRGGKIVVDNLYYDFMAAVAQLGLVPEGATT
ncbi:MAG TPA: nuclear transport factor 2 family protein [Gaiellaceae bacterium]|nr:nuclear transport factor 2 family protein [Gaiellaceae bacterium]